MSVISHVRQSTYQVSDDADAILSTVLGSCVAACLHDSMRRIGGMNHFLLPADASNESTSNRYGVNLMEQLINDLLKHGASKRNLVAKVFGGANVSVGGSTVGARNGEFVKKFLACEGIPCVAASLGGDRARRVRFWPASGRASQLVLCPAEAQVELVPAPREPPAFVAPSEPEIWS